MASAPPQLLAPAAGVSDDDWAALLPEAHWIQIASLGTVAAALREAGEWSVDDPPYRFDGQDWWFRQTFDVPQTPAFETVGRPPAVVLGLDGLATWATVWLNGQLLLRSSNMFHEHVCDVSDRLKPVGNELLIQFQSMDVALKAKRKRPRWRVPMLENQQLRWIRTTVLGRTPGWSPPVPPVGPWRSIWLEQRHYVDVSNIWVRTQVEGADGRVSGRLDLAPLQSAHVVRCQAVLSRNGVQSRSDAELIEGGAQFVLTVAQAHLWWPHTHGEPALYELFLALTLEGVAAPVAVNLGRVGFRTIAIDTQEGDFSVSVNGVPVFCRGACWTPLDMADVRATPAAYSDAIAQLRDAGMNMVRVAGTTVYEDDAFWDACDEAGVLVWQDFMFANMDYPLDDPEFAASVEREVRQQIARIRSRPSLALFCGNSEVSQQAAMWGAPKSLWTPPFFETTLPAICAELAPDCRYWPSSAYGGTFPFQADSGTTSYYGVGAYLRAPSDARTSGLRFATECLAFANVPADATLERLPGGLGVRVHHANWKARTPRDLGAGWDFDDVRDHYLQSLWGIDSLKLRYADHDRYLQLSRIVTGELMAQAYAQWRRQDSACRGALLLYLRDLWPAAGWGVLDDKGLPKPCFYFLKRVMQPLFLGLSEAGGDGLWIDVVNEGPQQQTFSLELVAWRHGNVRAASGGCTLDLAPHQSTRINAQTLFDHFIDFTHAYRFGPAFCDGVVATLQSADASQSASAFYVRDPDMLARESDLLLSGELEWRDAVTAALKVRANRFARYVVVDAPGFSVSDNYFHLAPDAEATILLRATASAGSTTPMTAAATATATVATDCVVSVSATNAHPTLRLQLKATA